MPITILALIAAQSLSLGTPCLPRSLAPGTYDNPAPWGAKQTDTGAVTYGFVDLKRGDRMYDVHHGTDLSSWNRAVNYDDLAKCGATFSFVKIPSNLKDESFRPHLLELKRRRIVSIPYFYLGVTKELKSNPAIFRDDDPEVYQTLLAKARIQGRSAGQQFKLRYATAFDGHPPSISIAGISGQIVGLDVEEKPIKSATRKQRAVFGSYYAAMLGAWLTEVRIEYPRLIPILYTTPSVFDEELAYAEPSDNKLIYGLPIWLANTRANAGDADWSKSRQATRLCNSAGSGNRCIVHQYTHRGVFAAGAHSDGKEPPHLDLNRLFRVRERIGAAGPAFVRAEAD